VKPVPHYHPGEVEACWDKLCVRVTTSEQAAAVIGGGLMGAFAGAILTRKPEGALVGAVLGGLAGAIFGPRDNERPTN
jgi:outer membrane lipoprotein SlyB